MTFKRLGGISWQAEMGIVLIGFVWDGWMLTALPWPCVGRDTGVLFCIGPLRFGLKGNKEQL